MKRFYHILIVMLFALSVLPVPCAADDDAVEQPEKKAAESMPAIPALLAEARYLTRKKPNL